MRSFSTCLFGLLIGSCLVVSHPMAAHASDGALEINATSAAAGSVTPGDASGFPVTLSIPGRYVLTGDLIVSSPGTHAVEIVADGVTLDLNDFSIRGPVSCTPGSPPQCSPSGVGVGVLGTVAYTVVRNGSVRGMANDCIRLGASARILGVVVAECGDDGIEAGLFATVRDVQSQLAVDDGITVGGSSRVLDCQAFSNGDYGIATSSHAIVSRSQVAGNGNGILVTNGLVRESTIVGNSGSGVLVDGAASIVGNLVSQNQGNAISGIGGGNRDSAVVALNAITGNQFSGISFFNDLLAVQNVVSGNIAGITCADLLGVDEGCSVLENTIVGNRDFGIFGPSHLGFSANVLNANGTDVSTAPIEFGTNICSLDTTCP